MDYPAEAFDQMQSLWGMRRFNDHQLRCVLRLTRSLDAEMLRTAVFASLKAFPILATRYIGGNAPRWASLAGEDMRRAFLVVQDEFEFENFLASNVDESMGPQVRVCLLNTSPCSVALKMNHMICDAADFKRFLYCLCNVYGCPASDTGPVGDPHTPDRSVLPVLRQFRLRTRIKSLLLQSNQNNHAGGRRFPMSGGETRPLVMTRTVEPERTVAIKAFARSRGATLNDVLLTSFYRCLFRSLNLRPGNLLRVPVMVDMRRYLPEASDLSSLANLTSTVSTQLKWKPAECFEDTLRRVKALMDQRKRSSPGLNGFIKLDRTYRFLGSRIANCILMARMQHPLCSMTNMGILDARRIWFGAQRPVEAFFCGSIKYQPYLQLSVSSYDGQLTLGINLMGSPADRDRILSLIDEIVNELPQSQPARRVSAQAPASETEASHQHACVASSL